MIFGCMHSVTRKTRENLEPTIGIMYEEKPKEKHNLSIVERVAMTVVIEIT
jgi:hypothetical protein